MKFISWNARGINGLSKHRMLYRKIHQEKPTILLIQETKRNSDNIQDLLLRLLKNSNSIAVDAAMAFGGLAIAWNPTTIILNDFTTTKKLYLSILSSHWHECTWLHHQCLWSTNFITKYQPSEVSGLVLIRETQTKLDPRWRLKPHHQSPRKKRRMLPSLTGGHYIQELHWEKWPGGPRNHQWHIHLE